MSMHIFSAQLNGEGAKIPIGEGSDSPAMAIGCFEDNRWNVVVVKQFGGIQTSSASWEKRLSEGSIARTAAST